MRGVWGYYRLLAIKDLTLNSQRIHGQIPVSDLSLTHLYSARLRRTRSLHPSLSQLKSFIRSLSSPATSLCPPLVCRTSSSCCSLSLCSGQTLSRPTLTEKVEPLIDLGPKCPVLVPDTDSIEKTQPVNMLNTQKTNRKNPC